MKRKIAHIWLYYKWYFIAGAAVIVLALNFLSEKKSQPRADYDVAIVTGTYVSEEVREQLADRLETIWGDVDGDGKTVVRVNFYQYDAGTMDTMDTASFMARAVQLAADLQEKISVCFFTDKPELLTDNTELAVLGTVDTSRLAEMEPLEGFTVLAYSITETAQVLFEGE